MGSAVTCWVVRVELHGGGRGEARVQAAVQGIRAPEAHRYRQWASLRGEHAWPGCRYSLSLVGAPRGSFQELDQEPGRAGGETAAIERMHRTLKAETTRPPAEQAARPAGKFDRLREEFDHERPHEALDPAVPGGRPRRLARDAERASGAGDTPTRFEVRYVSANGGIRWNRKWVNVSIVCVGEYVGLEEIDDGIWEVYFGPLKLGRLNERRMLIEDELGRLKRHNV